MQFLYFEPQGVSDRSQLDHLGEMADHGVSGPEGKRGRLLFNPRKKHPVAKLCCNLDAQTWRKMVDSDYWIGYWNDDPPKPEELEKETLIDYNEVKLYGGTWKVPIARGFQEERMAFDIALPRTIDVNEAGDWCKGPVVKRFRHISDAAQKWFDFKFQEPEEEIRVFETDMIDWCRDILSGNYYLSTMEFAMCEIETSDRMPILDAAIDWRAMEDHLKKKRIFEPSDSTPGSRDTAPATVPA